ncbi:MAG: hypothetical protein MJ227_02145 [Bacilli bacterium]|nr:hypothetical protein [Bacilli bacterium]
MRKKLLLLLLLPLTLTSCGNSHNTFNALKTNVDKIEKSSEHPYYKVIGRIDFNNEVIDVNATFDKQPNGTSFVPYARYNEGFYCAYAGDNAVTSEEDVVIYGMASRSYWLRVPLKIDKENFYVLDETNSINPTCAYANITKIIASWAGQEGSVNPSNVYPYFDVYADGSFAIGGDKVHTSFKIDNYPFYPDPNTHPEIGPWKERNPLPCYLNKVDAKVNIRFEYDSDGWLKREYLATIDYDYNKSIPSQLCLEAVYSYKFADLK